MKTMFRLFRTSAIVSALGVLTLGASMASAQKSEPPIVLNDDQAVERIWEHVDLRMVRQIDVWFDNGEFPRIISMLRARWHLSPTDYEMATDLGWMLENVKETEEAIEVYEKFIKVSPKDPNVRYPLAFLYNQKKQFEKVVALLEPTLTMKPVPDANSFRTCAKAYERLGKFKDAIRVWEMQLKAYPGDLPAKANIDRVKKKMGG